jgi:tetratricopeptide (TPR) repeat protein
VNAYIKANIESENWLQAYEMSQLTALDLSPAEIVKNYYTVAEHLFIEGDKDKALKLLDELVAARPVEESRVQTVNVAQRLSDERLFEPAYRLFIHLAENATGLNRKHLSLRCAYLALELGDDAAAQNHISSALAIEEDDASILGELELVYGVQAFRQDDSNLALKRIGHALVKASPESSLKLVGLYYNYLCYMKLGEIAIAQNILDEMRLLFPDAAYTLTLEQESKLQS